MSTKDDIIKSAVEKFLGWQLPEDFSPDCGISFEKFHSHNGPSGVQQYKPVGTNLLTVEQARAMFEHCLGDRIDRLEAELKRASEALRDAAEEVEGWGSYADEHFQKKWDLPACVANINKAADAIDAAMEAK